VRTADYSVTLKGRTVLVEVKELLPDAEERRILSMPIRAMGRARMHLLGWRTGGACPKED